MKQSSISIIGKRIVLTGAAGFLGTEMTRALLEEGAALIALDTLKKDEALARFEASDIEMRDNDYYECDITSEASLKKVAAEIKKAHGGIDVLINNAARNPKVEDKEIYKKTFETFPLEEWERELRVNLTGTMLVCREMRPLMEHGASIINIASVYGIVAPDQRVYPGDFEKPASYGASKAGVISLTRHLASLWGKDGIRVNAVVYGGFENQQDATFVKSYSERVPLGRMAKREEAAGVIVFLASDASSYATGSICTIDGGFTAW